MSFNDSKKTRDNINLSSKEINQTQKENLLSSENNITNISTQKKPVKEEEKKAKDNKKEENDDEDEFEEADDDDSDKEYEQHDHYQEDPGGDPAEDAEKFRVTFHIVSLSDDYYLFT